MNKILNHHCYILFRKVVLEDFFTRIDPESDFFKWTIRNPDSLLEEKEICSPVFYIGLFEKDIECSIKLCREIISKGRNKNIKKEDRLSIYIKMKSSEIDNLEASVKFRIIGSDNVIFERGFLYENLNKYVGYEQFISSKTLSDQVWSSSSLHLFVMICNISKRTSNVTDKFEKEYLTEL